MKNTLIVLGACLAVVCVTASALSLTGFRAKRALREANQELRAKLKAAEAQSNALLAEKEASAKQLTLVQDSCAKLNDRIAAMEAADAREAESRATAPIVTPYQAQAYLGQQSLGLVWIMPRNLRMDTNSQRYVYEPIVWIDEGLRKNFVINHTNVVVREIESQTYNNSYYPEPYYYGYYPFYSRPATNCWPSATPWPSASSRPTAPSQPAAPKFDPGSGKTTPQRLGTPAGKTRPQVPSKPVSAPNVVRTASSISP